MTDNHKEPNYMGVFYLLAVLTVVEIGVIYLPIGKLIIGFMLVSMALVKAGLVGAYFMHLKSEKRMLGLIALTPLVICTFLMFMLLPDVAGTPHQSSAKTPEEPSSSLSQQ
jgi:cytochrome c oxidase subunit 4